LASGNGFEAGGDVVVVVDDVVGEGGMNGTVVDVVVNVVVVDVNVVVVDVNVVVVGVSVVVTSSVAIGANTVAH